MFGDTYKWEIFSSIYDMLSLYVYLHCASTLSLQTHAYTHTNVNINVYTYITRLIFFPALPVEQELRP